MVPASTVGGDYYDIIRTDGSDWLLIGDVSGHGVTAGLTMMMIQTAIRTVVLGNGADRGRLTPAQVLSRVNDAVRRNGAAPRPYAAGTWGPAGAFALIEREGRAWHEN